MWGKSFARYVGLSRVYRRFTRLHFLQMAGWETGNFGTAKQFCHFQREIESGQPTIDMLSHCSNCRETLLHSDCRIS